MGLTDLNLKLLTCHTSFIFSEGDSSWIFRKTFLSHPGRGLLIIRAKRDFRTLRIYFQIVDKAKGVHAAQTMEILWLLCPKTLSHPAPQYPHLRCWKKREINLSNQLLYAADRNDSVLFRWRWKVELFFKWIKQFSGSRRFMDLCKIP